MENVYRSKARPPVDKGGRKEVGTRKTTYAGESQANRRNRDSRATAPSRGSREPLQNLPETVLA